MINELPNDLSFELSGDHMQSQGSHDEATHSNTSVFPPHNAAIVLPLDAASLPGAATAGGATSSLPHFTADLPDATTTRFDTGGSEGVLIGAIPLEV